MAPADVLPNSTDQHHVLALVLGDARIAAAVRLAVRDATLRVRFWRLRAEGVSRDEALHTLQGPHEDEQGRVYWLSAGTVRNLVYPKPAASSQA